MIGICDSVYTSRAQRLFTQGRRALWRMGARPIMHRGGYGIARRGIYRKNDFCDCKPPLARSVVFSDKLKVLHF